MILFKENVKTLQVGLYSDETTRQLKLDSAYQFQSNYCDDIDSCMSSLWIYNNVSALLVPYADVLTVKRFQIQSTS